MLKAGAPRASFRPSTAYGRSRVERLFCCPRALSVGDTMRTAGQSSTALRASRDYSLLIPDVEAPGMHLDRDAFRRRYTLQDELRFVDDVLAAVTRFASARTAPYARDTVVRQATISQLPSNEDTDRLRVHVAAFLSRRANNARLTRVSAPKGTNPKGQGAGAVRVPPTPHTSGSSGGVITWRRGTPAAPNSCAAMCYRRARPCY